MGELFGPSKAEVWSQLSTEIGARYVDGGFWGKDRVEGMHGQWTITLDTYRVSTGQSSQIYTRMRAPYMNPDGFRFTIYREGLFSGLGKSFGMQDIQVGYEPFDEEFIIKGNDEAKVKSLFSNQKIRDLITAQPKIHLTVKDDEGFFGKRFPEGVDELYFQVQGVIKNLEQLKSLYELFGETLDQLRRIGSAYENAPSVEL